MAVALLVDVHVPRAVVLALRLRGVDVRTAQEEGLATAPDDELLAAATAARRVVVTSDHDFLAIGDAWLASDRPFTGIIFVHPLRVSIGNAVLDLALIAGAGEPADLADGVVFLPL